MRRARLLLVAQVGHIGGERFRFRVAFRVAGARKADVRRGVADKVHQVAGMVEVGAFGPQRGAVAPQSQHIPHAGGAQGFQLGGGLLAVAAHAQHMGQRLDAQLVFEEAGHLHRRHPAGRAACAVSDADKVRVQRLHAAQGVLHGGKFGGLLGREALDGKNAGFLPVQLRDGRHGVHSPFCGVCFTRRRRRQAAGASAPLSSAVQWICRPFWS